MTTSELLVEAYRRGHAWGNPALHHLDESRVAKMDGSEADAKLLMASRQASDANFRPLVAAYHQREPIFDGIIGPATKLLVEIPRCPLPDFSPPPNASFHYDDPGVQKAVESMQANALLGSGSWPACNPDRPDVHGLRVRLSPDGAPSTIKGYFAKALDAVIAAYAEMGCALKYVPSGDCEIEKEFIGIAGSVIGWNEFPNPGTCDQTISGRLDTGYAPSDYRLFANLECHETGHGVGLNHTNGHIMNPSILLVWPLSWIGGPSESSMRRYFGGVPLPPVTPPDPPPVPIPGEFKLLFRGEFEGFVDGKSVGKFILFPKFQV